MRIFRWLSDLFVRLIVGGMDMVDEFQTRFPGKCPICAYHRYGIMHGHVKAGEPCPSHEGCPEEK